MELSDTYAPTEDQWRDGVAHLEFCFVAGRVVPFELNPRLIGDPAPRQLADAYDIDLARLLVAVAKGERGTPPAAVTAVTGVTGGAAVVGGGAAAAGGKFHALVDIRAPLELAGRRLAGLDLADPPDGHDILMDVDLDQVAGDLLEVSPLRGPKRVATVSLSAGREEYRDRAATWAAEPDRLRVAGRPAVRRGRMRAELARDLPDREEWPGLAATADVFSSGEWLSAVRGMPGAERTAYAVVRDDVGLVAAAPLWIADVGLSSGHRPPGTAPARTWPREG